MDLPVLIRRFRGPLVGLLTAWGNGPRDAAELAQDTFAEAYLGRARFRGDWAVDGDVGPWLMGIASNLHHAQRRRRDGPAKLTRLDSLDALPPDAVTEDPRDDEVDVAAVQQALAELRDPWRVVLCMRYVDGAALPEIGALLGLSTRAVEGRLRRARQELRRRLERKGLRAARPAEEPRP